MNELKQIIVIRRDLKLRRGKEIAQGAHAAMGIFRTDRRLPQMVRDWLNDGQKKIVLQVGTESALFEVEDRARRAGLLTYLVCDAGHTEIEPGTYTALGIGPDYSERLDPITKDLKLY